MIEPVHIRKHSFISTEIQRIGYAVSRIGLKSELRNFISDFSELVNAGISVLQALDAIEEETTSSRMRRIIAQIVKQINQGESLNAILEEMYILPSYQLALIRTGEYSGRLAQNLRVIVLQNTKEARFKARIRSSLLYVFIILFVTVVVGGGTAVYTLPRLVTVFAQSQSELPLPTIILLETGRFIANYIEILLPLIILVSGLLFYIMFSFPRTRFIGRAMLFHMPIIGRLIQYTEISRFGFFLGTMTEAGISVRDALKVLPQTTVYGNYKLFYAHISQQINRGDSFHDAINSYKKVKSLLPLPPRRMISAGEQSGTLDVALKRVGEMYEEKVEVIARDLPTLLEPIIIVVLGLVVAFFALGIFLPIYNYSYAF